MEILTVFFFLLGLSVGSFLNVLTLRYGTESSVGGRSRCRSCGTTLRWFELVPLVSFLALRGRCRSCGTRLSLQYPIVELGTALLFVLVLRTVAGAPLLLDAGSLLELALYLSVVSVLVAITVYDYHHKIIPDPFVYTLALLSVLKLFVAFSPLSFVLPPMLELLAGPILFVPFSLLWFISRGAWIGFGDAKLALAIGWLLGLRAGTSAIIFAFWIGALYFLLVLAAQNLLRRSTRLSERLALGGRPYTMKSEVPFGPFLVLGTLLVLLTGADVLSFVTFLLEL